MTHHLLNQTLTLPNGTVLRNRLAKAAMSETLGTYDNRPTPNSCSCTGAGPPPGWD
jgi:2,4-dienoyl-CoA reductase-like NADH-dependent reductase (Old Yellow Enzyme family)